jgi:hypothetical protein
MGLVHAMRSNGPLHQVLAYTVTPLTFNTVSSLTLHLTSSLSSGSDLILLFCFFSSTLKTPFSHKPFTIHTTLHTKINLPISTYIFFIVLVLIITL